MGREFELKFAATEAVLAAIEGRFGAFAPIAMETTYYDVSDGAMGRLRWTFRRRMENDRSVCTLKTPTEGLGRGEWEVECPDIMTAIPLLIAAGAPAELAELTAGGVNVICGARFTRLAGLLEIDGATVELALDEGILLGGGKALPFTEVEVELKSGSEEAVVRFANTLAALRGLKPELRSKVVRARALAAGE